jgi:hypothetical protein
MDAIKVYLGNINRTNTDWLKSFELEAGNHGIELLEDDIKLKRKSDFILYVFSLQDPSIRIIVDVVDDSNHFKEKTLFCTLDSALEGEEGFTKHQKKSIIATGKMIELNGGKWIEGILNAVDHIKLLRNQE